MTYRQKIVTVVASIVLFGPLGSTASRDDFRPDMTLDLRKFGFEIPGELRPQAAYLTMQNKILFVDAKTVAISFVARNPRTGLSVRNKVYAGPYLFQTIFLDTNSWNVLRTQTWSDSTAACGLFPAPNGGFIVWSGLDLKLYTADGTLQQTLILNSKDFPRAAFLTQSPTGETLFALRSDRQGQHVLRIHASDLRPIGWLNSSGNSTEAGSDTHFAFLRPHGGVLPSGDVYTLDANDQSLDSQAPKKILTTREGCSSITFLDNETLGIAGGCQELTVMKISGEVLFQRTFEPALVGLITPCRDCELLATSTYTLSDGNSLLDAFQKIKPRSIILFNRKTHDLVELPPTRSMKYSSSDAFSPEGCTLTHQVDSSVEVYHLCATLLGSKLRTDKRIY